MQQQDGSGDPRGWQGGRGETREGEGNYGRFS